MLHVNDKNFQAEVVESDLPVILDFWAPWCGPCRALGPVFERIAADFEGRVKVGKVNIDEARGIAQQFGILSIPVVVAFKKGEPVDRITGFDGNDKLHRQLFIEMAAS